MYKVLLALAFTVCFAACKKDCSKREYTYTICAENDTVLAYQLITGKWYLRKEAIFGPRGSGTSKCYTYGPEPAVEFFADRTFIFHTQHNPQTGQYNLTFDSSSGGLVINQGAGQDDVTVCDNMLRVRHYVVPAYFNYVYTR